MDRILHEAALLACGPSHAFACFTEPARLSTWLADDADVEPVAGGKYELFWDLEDRAHDSTLGCKITVLVPDTLLAFEWRGARQFESFMNQADPLTHVVVRFHPRAAGTEVHLIHSGWRSSEAWEEARQWFATAWRLAFARLVEQAAR